jgi:hypothetical protein
MNRFITLLVIFLLNSALFTQVSAGVYKRVNPDGSVEFTDVPEEIGEKPIEVAPSSSYSPPPQPKTTTLPPAVNEAEFRYESVSITSPANDSTIRDNAGNISISVDSKPGLMKDHHYLLKMDGKPAGEGSSKTFSLNNIDRGSHSFIIQILDKDKKVLIESNAVVVHLHRASVKSKKK